MSDIRVGDLVMVVKPTRCCGRHTKLSGTVFVVSSFVSLDESWYCNFCKAKLKGELVAYSGVPGVGARHYRLKRIPPLSELESEKKEEKVNG